MCPLDGEALGKGEVVELEEYVADSDPGVRAPLKAQNPQLPSAVEIEEHNMTSPLQIVVLSLRAGQGEDHGPQACQQGQEHQGDPH